MYVRPGRLHEPSLRHVRRLHVMLTTELQSVQQAIPLPSRARARQVRPHKPSSRHVSLLHDILTAGVRCVKSTVQLSSPCAIPERPRIFDIRHNYRPADNKVDIAAVERDPYRRRIQLVVRSGDRRPHQVSAYSIQQIDAKGIVDFVLYRARFCDYSIGFETLYYK